MKKRKLRHNIKDEKNIFLAMLLKKKNKQTFKIHYELNEKHSTFETFIMFSSLVLPYIRAGHNYYSKTEGVT